MLKGKKTVNKYLTLRKVAKNVQEASQLIENGFEFICAIDDAKLFRKRK